MEKSSKYLKESLLDYETLANSLKENTKMTVRTLLDEAVRNTYNQILSEAEEDEDKYEVEEVEDTTSDESNEADEKNTDSEESVTDSDDVATTDDDSSDNTLEGDTESGDGDDATEITSAEITDEPNGEEWADFDKYKITGDEYDFSKADDEEIVKVYKLLKDDDKVMVSVDNNKVELKDNESGAEYLIDLGSAKNNSDDATDTIADNESVFDENTENDMDAKMNESKFFEIVLNEYDSHVGYTDNYQKKDVMTTPNNDEHGKNVNTWDAGVPKGKSKPWAGKGNSKPYEIKVNEEDEAVTEEQEETVDEATNVGGFVQQNSTSKSHVPNSNGRKARNSSVAGVKTKSTSEPRYDKANTNESKMVAKVNKILDENKKLQTALDGFKKVLMEANVTNHCLGKIVKLISENSTTSDEKKEIIKRFGKEVKTIEESEKLYESISNELKKNKQISIEEDKQFTANGSQKINETKIYQTKDLMDSLELMHKICK